VDAHEKLQVLADASRFDLSCACGTRGNDDHRRRGPGGLWLYPASLPRGGASVMLKTLLSNACANDCRYCPFRCDLDTRRTTLTPDEVARAFMEFVRRLGIHGLFLSSGVVRDADHTMELMATVVRILRAKHEYRGFLHLKIIPGASDAAIEEVLSLADAVSLNIEVPTAAAFAGLSGKKDYFRDIVRPLKRLSQLTARGSRYAGVHQSTQFLVGAANETDAEIVKATGALYRRWGMNRVYFSAYQRGLGDPALPGERDLSRSPEDVLTREHRLYQVDWLLRKYGFEANEIPFDAGGQLPLAADPKEIWASRHPEFFPVDANRADRWELLRVPGLGPATVDRVLALRRNGGKLRSLHDLGAPSRRLKRAAAYVQFGMAPVRRDAPSPFGRGLG